MSLKETFREKINAGLKRGGGVEVDVLRMMLAAIANKEIESRGRRSAEGRASSDRVNGEEGTLTDEEVQNVLRTEAKKRREAIEAYKNGGRPELAERELAEVRIIEEYLPAQMSDEELKEVISRTIKDSGLTDVGSAMKAVMTELKGRADGSRVSAIVKQILQ